MSRRALLALALVASTASASHAGVTRPAVPPADAAAAAAGFKPYQGLLYRVIEARIIGDGQLETVVEVRNPTASRRDEDNDGFHALFIDEDGLGVMAQKALQLDGGGLADLNLAPHAATRFRFVVPLAPNHGRLRTMALVSTAVEGGEAGGAFVRWPIAVAGDRPDPPAIQARAGTGRFTHTSSYDVRIDAIHQDVSGAAELFFTVRNIGRSKLPVGGNTLDFIGTGANGKPAISWNRTFSIRGARGLYDYNMWLLPGGEARLRKFFGGSPTVIGPFTLSDRYNDLKTPIPEPGAPAPRVPSGPGPEPVW